MLFDPPVPFRPPFILILALWLAAPTAMPRVLTAQEPGALEVLRALPLDSLDGVMPVYHSIGHAGRAATLQGVYEAAVVFYRDTLNHRFDATLAVLAEEDWTALDWGPPYGMPWVTYRGPVPVLVLPATTERGVVADLLRRVQLDDSQVGRGIENIGFHELGHALVQQYLYPGELRTPPVRWFDEFMATYMGQGYTWMTDPATFQEEVQQSAQMLFGPRPPMTSLSDFEANYGDLSTSSDGANYGWYQTQFAVRSSEILEARGLEFLTTLRQELPWDRFPEWTSEELLAWLERIEPGFAAWAASLGS
jgi:hypothetical protein